MLRENVRISNTGYDVLSNKELAEKLAKAIIEGQDKLKSGNEIKVAGSGSNLTVKLVTSLSDQDLSTNKK